MSRVYRVLRKAFARSPFDGDGAYRYGGRWSSAGTRLIYASQHQSLAMLEYFVHIDKDDPPDDLVLAVAEIPDLVSRKLIDIADLRSNSRDPVAPPELAQFGDDFVGQAQNCLLLVPSALAPRESNWLMNPAHPEFKQIAYPAIEPLKYHVRMFAKQRYR